MHHQIGDLGRHHLDLEIGAAMAQAKPGDRRRHLDDALGVILAVDNGQRVTRRPGDCERLRVVIRDGDQPPVSPVGLDRHIDPGAVDKHGSRGAAGGRRFDPIGPDFGKDDGNGDEQAAT